MSEKIEQETVNFIVENKEIDFSEEYYKLSHFFQTAQQIQEDKKEDMKDYLKTVLESNIEEIKRACEQEKEDKKKFCIETVGANDGMIVED